MRTPFLFSSRREFIRSMGLGLSTLAASGPAFAIVESRYQPPEEVPRAPFNPSLVDDLARELARKAFEPPSTELPATLQDLEYVQYRDIYFRPDSAVWKGEKLPFLIELFHRGFYFKDKIEIAIVEDDFAKHLAYSPRLFGFGKLVPRPLPSEDMGFAGLRLSTSVMQKEGDYAEFLVFQGASYMRSRGMDQHYGLSARGLAVKTAAPEGEEFPIFRDFWVERPEPHGTEIIVHALLDSPSVSGAYHFRVRPGDETVMDVTAKLFPRTDLAKVGLAPATSMFFFDSNGRQNVDDYRPQVHDSDGLLMLNGAGERLWRPLQIPSELAGQFLPGSRPCRLRTDPARSRFRQPTRISRRPTSIARACGSSRSAVGDRAR